MALHLQGDLMMIEQYKTQVSLIIHSKMRTKRDHSTENANEMSILKCKSLHYKLANSLGKYRKQ